MRPHLFTSPRDEHPEKGGNVGRVLLQDSLAFKILQIQAPAMALGPAVHPVPPAWEPFPACPASSAHARRPVSPGRSESGRGTAAWEVAPLQRELGGGHGGRGGHRRHHREAELRPLVQALQAQALGPVGAALRQGQWGWTWVGPRERPLGQSQGDTGHANQPPCPCPPPANPRCGPS